MGNGGSSWPSNRFVRLAGRVRGSGEGVAAPGSEVEKPARKAANNGLRCFVPDKVLGLDRPSEAENVRASVALLSHLLLSSLLCVLATSIIVIIIIILSIFVFVTTVYIIVRLYLV